MTPARGAPDPPYVDRPPGSIEGAAAAARVAAGEWALPGPVLVRMGMNATFRAGDTVLRVNRPNGPSSAAIALANVLTGHGVRVAAPARREVVEVGGLAVTAWERLDAIDRPTDWETVGRMVARVHQLTPADVPAGYPLPPCESFPWWQFDELLDQIGAMIDAPARRGLAAAVERHRGWHHGVGRVVCHGDVHPGNVLMTADGPALLDWDLLCHGPPGWDHAMLLRLPRWGWPPSWYDDFAAGYGRSLVDDPVTVAIAELRLVAATLMRLRAGRDDSAAIPEAQLRLAYWRGDPDAPTWTAV